jgi:hypothetical protein
MSRPIVEEQAPPAPELPMAFAPAGQASRRKSAATRMGATLMAGAIVALTSAGVALYYIGEPFK